LGNNYTLSSPGVRWLPFTGYVNSGSLSNGNGYTESWRIASFNTSLFSISMVDSVTTNNGVIEYSNRYNEATHIDPSLILSSCIGGMCFVEGTQVVVGIEYDENDVFVQYITVNIEDIQVGDLVYSYNTLTGEVEQKEVTAVMVRQSDHINYLTIEDENGNVQMLEVTDAHPFWVVTDEPDLERAARAVVDENGVILYHENLDPGLNGFWVEAKDLREGDVLLGANGELVTVVANERVACPDGVTVYNFTVEGNHN
jgi:hypothetical protein